MILRSMSRPASSLGKDIILRVFQGCDLRSAAIAAAVCPFWSALLACVLCDAQLQQGLRSPPRAGTSATVRTSTRSRVDAPELTTKELLPGGEVGYLQHFNVVRNLTQLAPLLQRLASLELGLETANAAAGLVALQQLLALRRLKLGPSTPGRKLRLKFTALRLLPSSLTELHLNFVPATGDDAVANVFPTVCLQNLRKLVLHFGAVPRCLLEVEPLQATDALCPLLTWLEVSGKRPSMREDSELEELGWRADGAEETMSAQFLTRFPALQTFDLEEGHVSDFDTALEEMPHLVAARLHLVITID